MRPIGTIALSLALGGCPGPASPTPSDPQAVFQVTQSGKTLELPTGSILTVSYRNDHAQTFYYDGDPLDTVAAIYVQAKARNGQPLASLLFEVGRDSLKLFKEIQGRSWNPIVSATLSVDWDAYRAQGVDVHGLFPVSGKSTPLTVNMMSGASPFKGSLTYQITRFDFNIPDLAINK